MSQLEAFSGVAAVAVVAAAAAAAPGELFTDAAFPAGVVAPNDVLGGGGAWKRPHELRARPRLFVEGARGADVVQGVLGDCWFLSACVAVAPHPDLLRQIIPLGQVLYGDGYSGKLTFRFWNLGRWEAVHIDDRLPVDESGQLLYSRSTHPDEFWVPLMEKAFAKFHGGWAALAGGWRAEALLALTGRVVEDADADGWDDGALFELLLAEARRRSLVTCSARGAFRKGVAGDHAYALTGARRVRTRAGREARLLRLRNPWGADAAEWSGAWRDGDPRWNEIDQSTKESMGYKAEEDGEFWMEDVDFVNYFDHISLAMKTPLLDGVPMDDIENFHVLHGSWEKGISAGGSQKDMKMFATNPQFSLIVKETDDSYIEGNQQVAYCNVILELIQDLNREKYSSPDGIALFIYKVERPWRRLSARELAATPEWGAPAEHEARAAVLLRAQLPPGAYVLVASAFHAGRARAFVLRAYSRRRVALRRL